MFQGVDKRACATAVAMFAILASAGLAMGRQVAGRSFLDAYLGGADDDDV